MIKIEQLVYQIGEKTILNNLQMHIQRGQYFSLAGENGAGKSTLIKIILDLIRNTESGSIQIDRQDHRLKSTRKGIAYLPEKFDVKKEVSGWQYLKFICGIYQKKLDKDRVNNLCQLMSLDVDRLEDKVGTFSKGMKQKLGLISCFMLDTPLIILDEPLSGLDPKARFHFKELLQQERQNNRTIFYSTHMLADAEEICDQFAICIRGKSRLMVPPSNVCSSIMQIRWKKPT